MYRKINKNKITIKNTSLAMTTEIRIQKLKNTSDDIATIINRENK